jgi:hypothetical protein
MPDDEYRCFVTAGTRTAKWAIARRDGLPAMPRDPRVGFCIDDDRPLCALVLIDGCASVNIRCGAAHHSQTRSTAGSTGE